MPRISGEWLVLVAVGLALTALKPPLERAGLEPSTLTWAGVGGAVALYALLRLGGRTPIGITVPGTPAARGHPLLSLVACAGFLVLWRCL